jgi:hypothetical protein
LTAVLVISANGTFWRFAGDTEAFIEGSGGCSSGVADLVARGATLLRFFLGGVPSSSGDADVVVVVVAVVDVDAAVWSGSNPSLGSTMGGGGTLLFFGGRPRRLGAGAGAGAGAGVGVSAMVLLLADGRRGVATGAGVKSSPLSSSSSSSSSSLSSLVVGVASGVPSSDDDSTIAVRRVARRVGRVDMALCI